VSDGAVRIPLLHRLRHASGFAQMEEHVYGPVTIPAAETAQGTFAQVLLSSGAPQLVDHGTFAEERCEWVVTWTRFARAA
jgi:hypothetical protein